MKPKVTIVDYGRGNLFSIEQAAAHAGADTHISRDAEEILAAEHLILPGVGAFGDAMTELRQSGLEQAVLEFATSGRPLLGICLGMQMLFSESEEFGQHKGLGLVPGKVIRFEEPDPDGPRFKIPHISWAPICKTDKEWDDTILQGLADEAYMYFVHSFHCVPDQDEHILSSTAYGKNTYCSTVRFGNIYGCQYHPEKSGPDGLSIYKNFIHLV